MEGQEKGEPRKEEINLTS